MKTVYILIPGLALLLAACSVTGRLERRGVNAAVSHITKPRTPEPEPQATGSGVMEIKSDAGTYYFAPYVMEPDGEQILSVRLPDVTVVAKSRTLPERNGRVNVDFTVTIPRELLGTAKTIEVTPILHKDNQPRPLQALTIRGALFDQVQRRNYWQYEKYRAVYDPDSARLAAAFRRFVRFPYPAGVRLDSIVEHRETVSYHYTQPVRTDGNGRKLSITMSGRVTGLDGSSYHLPVGDTLEYYISSMLQFIDTTTRYMDVVISKYAYVRDRAVLTFGLDDSRLCDTLGDNRRQLDRITALMDELVGQQEYYVDTITLTASASPEGAYKRNERLARARAYALRDRLAARYGAGSDSLFAVRRSRRLAGPHGPDQRRQRRHAPRADRAYDRRDRRPRQAGERNKSPFPGGLSLYVGTGLSRP